MLHVEVAKGHIVVGVLFEDLLYDALAVHQGCDEGGVEDAALVSDVLAGIGDREVLVEPLSWAVAWELLEELVHLTGKLLPPPVEPRYIPACLRRHSTLRVPAHVAVILVKHRATLAIGSPSSGNILPGIRGQHTLCVVLRDRLQASSHDGPFLGRTHSHATRKKLSNLLVEVLHKGLRFRTEQGHIRIVVSQVLVQPLDHPVIIMDSLLEFLCEATLHLLRKSFVNSLERIGVDFLELGDGGEGVLVRCLPEHLVVWTQLVTEPIDLALQPLDLEVLLKLCLTEPESSLETFPLPFGGGSLELALLSDFGNNPRSHPLLDKVLDSISGGRCRHPVTQDVCCIL